MVSSVSFPFLNKNKRQSLKKLGFFWGTITVWRWLSAE